MSNEKKDLKDTLNLPQTAFPMKANLQNREPELLAFWEEEKIYEKVQDKNSGGEFLILHDGPPYANGHIHIGHALNKILKDIIVKYRSMQGYKSPYVPGWDCHGLPIEHQIDKDLGKKKSEVGILEKRDLCRKYALRFVDIQREEFKRLGVLGDWDTPYITMDYKYEGATVGEFVQFVKAGSAYKGKKPVHWCPSCVTALAEAEVEHADKESPSVFVKFEVADGRGKFTLAPELKHYIIIWTTTPWTLPANLALAVSPEEIYSEVKVKRGGREEVWVLAEALINPDAKDLMQVFGLTRGQDGAALGDNEYTVLGAVKGGELKDVTCLHPFIERESRVITGDFVTMDEGTGIVHIATGCGERSIELFLDGGNLRKAPSEQETPTV